MSDTISNLGPVGFSYVEDSIRDYAQRYAESKKKNPDEPPADVKGAMDQLGDPTLETITAVLDARAAKKGEPGFYREFVDIGLKNFFDDEGVALGGPEALQQIAAIVIDAIQKGKVGFTFKGFTTTEGKYSVEQTPTGCIVYVPEGRECESDPLPKKP